MHGVVYVFGSGLAFFLGVGCVLGAVAVSFGSWLRCMSVATALAILGIILVGLSGTPLPIWFHVIAMLLVVGWLVVMGLQAKVSPRWARDLRLLVALVWVCGAFYELPYQMLPAVAAVNSRQLDLFGDSLSAGIDENDSQNWPQLLARSHAIELSNYSRPGATVAVALRQANDHPLGNGLVLLEIGGNDLLGSTAAADFDHNLEALLERVCQPGRQVVMFELPLPPLRDEFGRIQRRLAARYHVLLIPKRVLTDAITGEGATLDSIHLSARGHQHMAGMVWQILRPAYER